MLAIHFFSCAFMTGVIWIIQILHYPAFASIDKASFTNFHKMHTRYISLIVGPMMITELATGLIILYQRPTDYLIQFVFILLILIWICTFAVSVPHHNVLAQTKDTESIQRLIRTNWPRTILWSLRSFALVWAML